MDYEPKLHTQIQSTTRSALILIKTDKIIQTSDEVPKEKFL